MEDIKTNVEEAVDDDDMIHKEFEDDFEEWEDEDFEYEEGEFGEE